MVLPVEMLQIAAGLCKEHRVSICNDEICSCYCVLRVLIQQLEEVENRIQRTHEILK